MSKTLSWIESQEATLIQQLETWCRINTGSGNLSGLRVMKHLLLEAFLPLADTHQAIGEALYFQKRPELKRRVLLCGHMDTVYPLTSSFQTPERVGSNHMRGPGVADMKGGLVVMLAALSAFEQTEAAQSIGWDVLINADEEIGSPGELSLFPTFKQQAGLVFEPAMDEKGTFAKARKGSGQITLLAKGVAAHAGRAFQEGRNAIVLLASALTQIHQLNNQKPGVTLNIGLIQGGEALNQVPAEAVAKLDIRLQDPQDQAWVEAQIKAICNTTSSDKTLTLTYESHFHRPPKLITKATQRLFSKVQHAGKTLGLTLSWQDSGGCCDGNNLAAQGMPVIDTLGVRGGHIHTPQEFMCLDSLTERASLTLLLLQDLAQGGLEELAV